MLKALLSRLEFMKPTKSKLPFDQATIDDHATRIMAAANESFSAIRKRLSSTPPDKPLFILLGEDHAVIGHILHQMALMGLLQQADIPFGVALEYPSNTLEAWAAKVAGVPRSEARRVLEPLLIQYPNTNKLLYDVAFSAETPFAPHTTATLIHFLKNRRIPIALVDAAADEEGFLDRRDPDTESAILEAERITGETAGDSLAFDDKLGMVARNLHMLNAGQRFFERLNGVRLILMCVGNEHVIGTND